MTNSGAVTLTALGGHDPARPGNCPPTTLAPGASATCTASYTITQADVDAGSVDNTATAPVPPRRRPVTPRTRHDHHADHDLPALALDKRAATPVDVDTTAASTPATPSPTRSWSPTPAPHADRRHRRRPEGRLGRLPGRHPGARRLDDLHRRYTITQADVDAGSVDNTAVANATTPAARPELALDTTTTPTSTEATLTLDKKAGTPTDVDGNGRVDAGDTIAYTFVVTNTGAVTLTGVAVTDPKVGAVTCPSTTLAPGASTTCTATYTITQADVDAGTVVNTATASATAPPGTPRPGPRHDQHTDLHRRLAHARQDGRPPVDVDGNGRIDAGDPIAYTFVVTNTGAVTLTGVAVTDREVGTVVCPVTTLRPARRRRAPRTTRSPRPTSTPAGSSTRHRDRARPPPAVTARPRHDHPPTATAATLTLVKTTGSPRSTQRQRQSTRATASTTRSMVTNTGA